MLARTTISRDLVYPVVAIGRMPVSELDVIKERIAYLKVWLGVLVVADITLAGWVVSNLGTPNVLLLIAGMIGVVVLTVGLYLLH